MFVFISGVSEHWSQSINLFHTRFGGKMFNDEIINQRAAKETMGNRRRMLIKVIRDVIGQDPWDSALYRHAAALFAASAAQYGIKK